MTEPTRDRARLLLSAVRVLAFREQAPPTPEEVAALLGLPPEGVRLETARLTELGILRAVRSAYALHLEVGDEAALAELPEEENAPAMDDALAEFRRRKEEEAQRMERLFQDGEGERRRRERLRGMDEALEGFRKKKPRNPIRD